MFHGKQEHGFLLRSWLKSWRPASPAVRGRKTGRERALTRPRAQIVGTYPGIE
jgi:hypothetical protein